MDERDWLTCTDPRPLLDSLGGRATPRKLLLFACACARRVWHLLPDPRYHSAAEMAEDYADEAASEAKLLAAWHAVCAGVYGPHPLPSPPGPLDWGAVATLAAQRCAALAGRERRGGHSP